MREAVVEKSRHRRENALAVCAYAVLTLLLFGDLLLAGGDEVISAYTGDISQYFTRIREFGVAEIRNGNLPLWNPHLMSGVPYLGNFQSALLYPLNAHYLLWPVAFAMNFDVALHVFLFGSFMFAWARVRGLSAPAAFFVGAVAMLSGPFYLRVLAGHVTMVAAMAWAPLLFLSVEKIFERAAAKGPLLGWTLLGVFATTMQILAGHPQTVFLTAVAVAFYCILRWLQTPGRIRSALALLVVGAYPGLMSAAQLLAGVAIGGESIRQGGVAYMFATAFSFPPENFLTMLVPDFFGDRINLTYWARWAFWDTSFYVGISALTLAIYGAVRGDRDQKRFATVMSVFLVLLALGQYTPFFGLFYGRVPGFDQFRSPSKFLFPAVMFLSMLAGVGADRLLRTRDEAGTRWAAILLWAAAAPLVIGVIWIALAGRGAWETSTWRNLLHAQIMESWLIWVWVNLRAWYFDATAWNALRGLAVAAATCLVLGAIFWRMPRSKVAVYTVLLIGIAEVFVFANAYRMTFRLSDHDIPTLEHLYASDPGHYRVLHMASDDNNTRNHALGVGAYAIWGYEPAVMGRYGEYLSYASGSKEDIARIRNHAVWGSDPTTVGISLELLDLHEDPETGAIEVPEMYKLFGCRYVVLPERHDRVEPGIYEIDDYYPRFWFARHIVPVADGYDIFRTLDRPGFDARNSVVLQFQPNVMPDPNGNGGEWRVQDESSDHITLTVDLPSAAILVVNNVYSNGWFARALPGSVQDDYQLYPANYAMQGIPMTAGHHELRLEYLPRQFHQGRLISIGAVIVYLMALSYWVLTAVIPQKTKNAT